MKIDGAIFDVDGTLLDSMYVWDKIGYRYLKSNNIDLSGCNLNEIESMSLKQAAEFLKINAGINKSVNEIMDGVNSIVEDSYRNDVLPKNGVMEFLELLKIRDIKMCIATATDRYLVQLALKRNKMEHYFSEIFTCTEVGSGKDKPKIFELALKQLGTPKNSTYIFEDALYAIKTAKKYGFKVVGLYDKSAEKYKGEVRELSDVYVSSVVELKEYFKL